jgi:thiol-disulfide isomerase/thioredoxin
MTTRSGARPAFGRLLLAAAVAAACPAPAAAAADTFVGATEMDWLADYDAALAAGRQAGQPVLVVFGAPWCEWCRKFATDLRGGPAKTALAGVTRVYLDFDAHRDLARKLGVGPIPAVRLVKATGGDPRIAGARDGYMPADEFLQWLGEARKVWAGEAPPVDLLEGDALTRAAVDKLVERFGDADVTARGRPSAACCRTRRRRPTRSSARSPPRAATAAWPCGSPRWICSSTGTRRSPASTRGGRRR